MNKQYVEEELNKIQFLMNLLFNGELDSKNRELLQHKLLRLYSFVKE